MRNWFRVLRANDVRRNASEWHKGLARTFHQREALPLTDDTIAQTVLFADLVSKPLIATFDSPLMPFLTIDDDPRQYLVAAVLRPGNPVTAVGAQGLLRRRIPKVWAAFARARVRVRLDGGFATPGFFDELEAAGVEYVVAIAKNTVPGRPMAGPCGMSRDDQQVGAGRNPVVITAELPGDAPVDATVQGQLLWPLVLLHFRMLPAVPHKDRTDDLQPRFWLGPP